jgi:23S rRNA pseudouridine1911/1915/1917 synthase
MDCAMNDLRLELQAEKADRLDKALATAHPEISRARFQRLIEDGHVTLDGVIATDGGAKTKPGQNIAITLPPPVAAEPEGEDIPLDILFEDKHLIVINKPAGLVVHPAAGHEGGTLVNALIAHCGDSLSGIGGVKRPGIVHRLDKDTSGVLVVAKNDKAHAALSAQFAAHGRDGKLERAYLAFVWGVPERKAGMLTTGIGRSSANRQKMAVSNKSDAREAITHFEVKEVFGTAASLFECRLETGRTHQIRVHMAHIGHPLLADRVYGSGYKSAEARLPDAAKFALNALKGQALHAYLLAFEHPTSHKKLTFQSPLPPDLSQLHHELRLQSPSK